MEETITYSTVVVENVECIGPRILLSDLIISIRHSCWPCPIGDEEFKLKYSTGIGRVRLEFDFLLISTDLNWYCMCCSSERRDACTVEGISSSVRCCRCL